MGALWIAAGVVIWALHFAAVYGFTALACARGWEAAIPWVVAGATLAAVAALGLVALAKWRGRAEFTAWMTIGVAGLALVAVAFEALPVLVVPACA